MTSNPGTGKWARLALIFVVLVLVDQCTKFLAVDRLTSVFEANSAQTFFQKLHGFVHFRELVRQGYIKAPYPVIEKCWHMSYVENPGAAWGLFSTMPETYRHLFFVTLSIGAIAFILSYYRKLKEDQRFLQVALALVLSGAVGNFIDRLVRHYVIDFIDLHWGYAAQLRWPTFNVADSLIVIGVLMLVVQPNKDRRKVSEDGRSGTATNP